MMGCCADRISAEKAGRFNNGCVPETCMSLPEGSTCGGCVYFEHCKRMYSHKAEDTYCDFFPRRFIARVPSAEEQ